MSRYTYLFFYALVLSTISGVVFAQEDVLRIGVRADAVSMSYKVSNSKLSSSGQILGPLREAGYDGYVVNLCDIALLELQRFYGNSLKISPVQVSSSSMWELLEAEDIDIVCGPTTATQERLQGRISSPPVFVSGASFAVRTNIDIDDCKSIAGSLRSTTSASSGLKEILQSNAWPRRDVELVNERISGGSDWKKAYENCEQDIDPLVEYESHDELSDAFCKGEVKYYVGDLEIVARSLQAARIRSGSDCDYSLSSQTFSEERYVILGNARGRYDSAANPLVAHFFEVLSRKLFFTPSAIDTAFESNFPVSRPSRKLEFLFWVLRGSDPNQE